MQKRNSAFRHSARYGFVIAALFGLGGVSFVKRRAPPDPHDDGIVDSRSEKTFNLYFLAFFTFLTLVNSSGNLTGKRCAILSRMRVILIEES
ncbi:MAG: hypothetical protein IKE69_08545 [Thermoguttaceae bacterium]|nr:hypothetical protein [Thermoguttaceae bacterium]